MNETIWIPTFQVDYITSVSLEIKVSFTIIVCTIFPLSYAMMYGIIRFELDGGDPQKRSTFNQLNSALFSIMDIYAFVGSTSMLIRAWAGPLGYTAGLIFMLLRRFYLCFAGLLIMTMLVIKCLALVKPKLVSKMKDNFWAFLLISLDGLFAALVPFADWHFYPAGQYPIIFVFISGNGDVRTATDHR